jgi:hypothetical protein
LSMPWIIGIIIVIVIVVGCPFVLFTIIISKLF